MNKHIKISLLLLFALIKLNAQEKKGHSENNQFKINILMPGINYERRLNENATSVTDLSLSAGFTYGSDSGINLLFSPYIREQYRYYYNFEKRKLKAKNIKNNSANFVALNGSYYFRPIGNSDLVSVWDGLTIGPIWGLQRTYESGLNIGLMAGLGYNFGTNERASGVVPIINFTLGWVIGGKQKR